ncbi:FAD-dependent monooxygenase, partial [Mycolicibacterium sp. CBMA 361]
MTTHPVVIVGAGPTGATLALLLAAHGVHSVVL